MTAIDKRLKFIAIATVLLLTVIACVYIDQLHRENAALRYFIATDLEHVRDLADELEREVKALADEVDKRERLVESGEMLGREVRP